MNLYLNMLVYVSLVTIIYIFIVILAKETVTIIVIVMEIFQIDVKDLIGKFLKIQNVMNVDVANSRRKRKTKYIEGKK